MRVNGTEVELQRGCRTERAGRMVTGGPAPAERLFQKMESKLRGGDQ
jgi:hypothetical protein